MKLMSLLLNSSHMKKENILNNNKTNKNNNHNQTSKTYMQTKNHKQKIYKNN